MADFLTAFGAIATAIVAVAVWWRDQLATRRRDVEQRESTVVADFAASVSTASDALDALERRIVVTLQESVDDDGAEPRWGGSLEDLLETTIASARRAVTELSSHHARIAFAFQRHSDIHMVDGDPLRVDLPDGYEPSVTDFAKLCADLCRSSVELAVLEIRRDHLPQALEVLRTSIDLSAMVTPDGLAWKPARRVGAGRIAIRLRDLIVSIVVARHSGEPSVVLDPGLRSACVGLAERSFVLRHRYDVELRGGDADDRAAA